MGPYPSPNPDNKLLRYFYHDEIILPVYMRMTDRRGM